MEEWKKAEGMECAYGDGSINENSDPLGGNAIFHSSNSSPALLGTGSGQNDCLKVTYGDGNWSVGVCGDGGRDDRASVCLQYGTVLLDSTISHDGERHGLSHNKAIFTAQPDQTVYFRVSRVGVGQFTVEMMVEGGPWGHLTPNGKPLLPKTEGGEAMEGLRVYGHLYDDKATVSDLCVGRIVDVEGERADVHHHHTLTAARSSVRVNTQHKHGVQGAGAEGERVAVPLRYPALLLSSFLFPLSRSLSRTPH